MASGHLVYFDKKKERKKERKIRCVASVRLVEAL
jgi:hypothetical protein